MSGFEADLAAIDVTARELDAAAESLSTAVAELVGGGDAGPGRLGGVAAALVESTRAELAGALERVRGDAAALGSVRSGYAERDQDVADRFRRLGDR